MSLSPTTEILKFENHANLPHEYGMFTAMSGASLVAGLLLGLYLWDQGQAWAGLGVAVLGLLASIAWFENEKREGDE